MALTKEWTRRIDRWRAEIRRHVYRPIETVALEGYTTTEQLTAAQAAGGKFAPMPAGTRWGAKWEYGWFRAQIAMPKAGAGRRIVLVPDFGGEALVFVNGKVAAARDKEHREITLSRKAKAGERYAVLAEAYAGHGPQECGGGPAAPGRETVPEPGRPSGGRRVLVRRLAGRRLPARHRRRDALPAAGHPGPRQPARGRDRPGAARLPTLVDFELPLEQMLRPSRRCRKRAAPLLACVNGSHRARACTPSATRHLDVAWLWPLAETERKAARTLSNQLALIR